MAIAAPTNIDISTDVLPIPGNIFRAYDIRGIAGTELSSSNIELIGRAIGTIALHYDQPTLLFGADGRLSSPELAAALKRGILSTGCNLVDLGIIPTPLLYFAAHTTQWSSGLILTASHNPAEYNGIKMVNQRTCLTPEQIQMLRSLIDKRQFARGKGSLTAMDIMPAYLTRISSDIQLQRPLKVVVDCGNAVPALVAPQLFAALQCEVVPLYCEVDGHFPNHHPDPTVHNNLQALISSVQEQQADLGIALDGDGDRVVLVTNSGNVIDTDRLLMLFIRAIVPLYHRPNARHPNVVFDVKCSNLLSALIEENGGVPVMSRSGHSFMKQAMQDTDAVVGAEFSAHVFIKDRWFGYDDGMYAAARFLEILAAGPLSAEQLLQSLPKSVVTPELRINVSDEEKFTLMALIAERVDFPQARINTLDGVRADFSHGWGLIRASNTTPALLLRFEADTVETLQQIQQMFRGLLSRVDNSLTF
jgi:phosphomannomutase / phosphoglucomutase